MAGPFKKFVRGGRSEDSIKQAMAYTRRKSGLGGGGGSGPPRAPRAEAKKAPMTGPRSRPQSGTSKLASTSSSSSSGPKRAPRSEAKKSGGTVGQHMAMIAPQPKPGGSKPKTERSTPRSAGGERKSTLARVAGAVRKRAAGAPSRWKKRRDNVDTDQKSGSARERDAERKKKVAARKASARPPRGTATKSQIRNAFERRQAAEKKAKK